MKRQNMIASLARDLLFALCILLTHASIAQTSIISTFAGNGTFGYNGDTIIATSAELNTPRGLAVDASGNVYIADEKNNRIRKVSTTGIITTVAGNGGFGYSGDFGLATSAKLYRPNGVAVDRFGNVYIADSYNHVIRKVDGFGKIVTIVGTGYGAGTVNSHSFSGDGGLADTATLNMPTGISVDDSGNLYITDEFNFRIRKVDTSGIITTIAGNGTQNFNGDNILATSAGLFPYGNTAIDTNGNLYFVDGNNNRVRKVNKAGIITTVAGNDSVGFSGDGGLATDAQFKIPNGVATDSLNNIYISDFGNERVRKISSATGIVTTIAGNGTPGFSGDGGLAIDAQFRYLDALTIDAFGNLYISDTNNERVRKVTNAISAGIEQAMNSKHELFTIYPNPSNGLFTLKTESKQATISITNILGESIYETKTTGNEIQIDLSKYSKGLYNLHFLSKQGAKVNRVLIE